MFPLGSSDRQTGADRRRDRLLDQLDLPGAGGEAGLLDGALLHLRHTGRRAHHDARARVWPRVDAADEVAEHPLGHLEVRDDAVPQGTDGRDRRGRAADHPARLVADGLDAAALRVDRYDGRLGQRDAASALEDQCVGGPEVDRDVAAATAAPKQGHREQLMGMRAGG